MISLARQCLAWSGVPWRVVAKRLIHGTDGNFPRQGLAWPGVAGRGAARQGPGRDGYAQNFGMKGTK